MTLQRTTYGHWVVKFKGNTLYTAKSDISEAIAYALRYKKPRTMLIMSPYYGV